MLFLGVSWLSACSQSSDPAATSVDLPETYNAALDDEKKVALARARQKEMDSIRKGDYMMTKNNPREALSYYLPLLERLPEDIVLHKKIANAYFLLKDWGHAYRHFVHVPILDLTEAERENMIFALFYDEHFSEKRDELEKFQFSDRERVYYTLIAACYDGIDRCVAVLSEYEGDDPRLVILKKIVNDATKVSPDPQYRNLLIAKQLYEQKMYRLVGMITSEVLANHQSYQESKKMRAFVLYELGKYSDAKDLLLSSLNDAPKDLEVIIRLGEVFAYLGDYKTANLYLNNAILAGYTPKTLLERRLAYNYAKIGDKEWMQKVLAYLLQESDVTEDDYAVAVSLAFEQGENIRAYAWAHQWVQKFPDSKILAPLYMQALRLVGKNHDATRYLGSLPESLASLPMVQLEKGILLFAAERYDEAKPIFRALQNYDDEADFALEAKNYLEAISEKEAESERQRQLESLSGAEQPERSFWDF